MRRAPRPTHSPPRRALPAGATDCHMHVFGPVARYPWAPRRLYTPPDASIEQYTAMCAQVGLQRVVLVQPSVYGTDNRAMLDAMRGLGPLRCRGVAVIDASTPDADLHMMQEAGVRGARLSLTALDVAEVARAREAVLPLAGRLASLGWHLQLILRAPMLGALASDFARLPVSVVIDHMGLPEAGRGLGQAGFGALLELLREGHCWVKLSAAYRLAGEGGDLGGATTYARALAEANPRQVVWGTDWPHPGHRLVAGNAPADGHFEDLDIGALLDLLHGSLPDEAAWRAVLVDNPARLYGFGNA
jgi:predicted TIM-barrel fold metal-dependent hydrolase